MFYKYKTLNLHTYFINLSRHSLVFYLKHFLFIIQINSVSFCALRYLRCYEIFSPNAQNILSYFVFTSILNVLTQCVYVFMRAISNSCRAIHIMTVSVSMVRTCNTHYVLLYLSFRFDRMD